MRRCPDCPNTSRCVPGDGPLPIQSTPRVMFIGSMPGTEGDDRRMFTGKSGREFNENYLGLAGLSRDDIYITNTRKCRTDSGRPPTPAEILSCAGYHLPDEIESANPEFIVLMGATACALVPEINLEVEHGIPTTATIYDWTGTVIPMDHPSGGMRDTSMMIPLLEDFTRLGKILAGEWVPPKDAGVKTDYQYIINTQQIIDSFELQGMGGPARRNYPKWPDAGVDMETHAGTPFSIQWSTAPGKAWMLRVDPDSIAARIATRRLLYGHTSTDGDGCIIELSSCLTSFCSTAIFHQAGGDLDVLNRVGISTPERIRDTMQEAYHLGNLPQGLKALAYRLLGIRMRSWKEVVGPPSRDAALDWIVAAIEHAQAHFQIEEKKQLKTKLKIIIKPSDFEKRLKAILRYSCFNDEYPIWEHMLEVAQKWPTEYAAVVSTHGDLPQLGIANCTPEDALEYACKDADVTLRISKLFDKLRSAAEFQIFDGDADVLP